MLSISYRMTETSGLVKVIFTRQCKRQKYLSALLFWSFSMYLCFACGRSDVLMSVSIFASLFYDFISMIHAYSDVLHAS